MAEPLVATSAPPPARKWRRVIVANMRGRLFPRDGASGSIHITTGSSWKARPQSPGQFANVGFLRETYVDASHVSTLARPGSLGASAPGDVGLQLFLLGLQLFHARLHPL